MGTIKPIMVVSGFPSSSANLFANSAQHRASHRCWNVHCREQPLQQAKLLGSFQQISLHAQRDASCECWIMTKPHRASAPWKHLKPKTEISVPYFSYSKIQVGRAACLPGPSGWFLIPTGLIQGTWELSLLLAWVIMWKQLQESQIFPKKDTLFQYCRTIYLLPLLWDFSKRENALFLRLYLASAASERTKQVLDTYLDIKEWRCFNDNNEARATRD